MHCFEKSDGTVFWEHDLVREFGAPFPGFNGYAPSPIAYENLVIVPVDRERPEGSTSATPRPGARELKPEEGGDGQALMAFDLETGSEVWRMHNFKISFSSPILISFEGETQLVLLGAKGIIGVNPESGSLRWQHDFDDEAEHLMTPVWLGDGRLLVSSTPAGGKGGTRVIELTRNDNLIVPRQVWHDRRVRFIQGNPIAIGDYVYGASGHNPALFVGVDSRTGKRLWGERGFDEAAGVFGDGKIIFLDWDGKLVLASATPQGLTIHSQCQVTERESFTAPTLVGKTLYVRDRKHIMALDLG
jgi:outer membrane protein assembly factor BamB